ncbi:MAG: hypothetical protein GTO45_18290, partial [Candidatus Aminicenantes bacterium]|nr:hypothetical protein [Candidatus Aminicenantes bacterium]NIM80250.1 hypothetical protein [Candidatus Aminicenantes bacterium]NIN20113.1 hypothetical protein [Candidatus Aminicenantes bacterium]NIN43900.1 hypothetical protein [Candidatus Aminicenantes bacterium]NIN86709.1 hypothetical protein [Candidatus Aminicenantes bacterium]
ADTSMLLREISQIPGMIDPVIGKGKKYHRLLLKMIVHRTYSLNIILKSFCLSLFFLPPAARGALFEKTAPLDSLQKLFINKINFLHPELAPVTFHNSIYRQFHRLSHMNHLGIIIVID